MQRFRNILPYISHFSLALMLTLLANGVLFFHSHELDNGRIITHAHPILGGEHQDSSDHGHSEMELIILDLMAHADYFIYEAEIEIPEKPEIFESIHETNFFLSHFSVRPIGFDHRGPPLTA